VRSPCRLLLNLAIVGAVGIAGRATASEVTPTGQAITPMAAAGAIFQPLNPDLAGDPGFTAGQASAVALSPDGRTLLILTSGFNRAFGPDGKLIPERSKDYVFVYDVSGAAPVKRQVLTAPDTFLGLAWAPSGDRFYVSGGVDDDVLEFVGKPGAMAAARVFALGHKAGLGIGVKPEAAGLAVSPDGTRLLVANLQNDSVSLIDLAVGSVVELDLRPGRVDPAMTGRPGGSFPRAVAWSSDARAYVASQRDREIIALDVSGETVRIASRIRTRGQPVALLAGPPGRLYAALDNSDAIAVIDTVESRIIETIATSAPPGMLRGALGGAGANALALSPDHGSLLVSDGGENAVAVVRLDDLARGGVSPAWRPKANDGDWDGDGDDDDDSARPGPGVSAVVGLVPTGWYPTAVAVRPDGRQIYVVNGKSNTGPVPGACRNNLGTDRASQNACQADNTYVWQREKAGFLTLPAPTPVELGHLTRQVAINDHFPGAQPPRAHMATLDFLRAHIRHVI
jgi:DNA-binding beta-propeller fold protein YncE